MNYFDHAATTLIYPEVLAILHKTMSEDFANPSSNHSLGKKLADKITHARQYFLNELKASSEDYFIFTSSATESNNTIISGLNLQKDDVVIYSKADHPSVVEPIEALKVKGVEIIPLKLLSGGGIDFNFLNQILSEKKISLAVFSHVNHQSGNIYNVHELSELVKKYSKKAHVHIDAVQAFTKIETHLTSYIDSMSITSHKIGGPKGIAGLYLKKHHHVAPLLLGGGQQFNLRSSTESYPLVAAFMEATKISQQNRKENFRRVTELKNLIEESVKNKIPSAQFLFLETSPYILSFVIPGISSDIILRHLEVKNTFISSTSACSSRIKGINSTLTALLIPEKLHKNILRISLGESSNGPSTQQFIDDFLSTWTELSFFVK